MNSNIAFIILLINLTYFLRHFVLVFKNDSSITLLEIGILQITSTASGLPERRRLGSQDGLEGQSEKLSDLLKYLDLNSPGSEKSLTCESALTEEFEVNSKENMTEEKLMELIYVELEQNGVSRHEATKEDIHRVIVSNVRRCYSKWKKVKRISVHLEDSLNELESKRKSSPPTENDLCRQYLERQNEIILQQEKLSALESVLAARYTLLLTMKQKHSPRRSRSTQRQTSQSLRSSSASSVQSTSSSSSESPLSGSPSRNQLLKQNLTKGTTKKRKRRKRRRKTI